MPNRMAAHSFVSAEKPDWIKLYNDVFRQTGTKLPYHEFYENIESLEGMKRWLKQEHSIQLNTDQDAGLLFYKLKEYQNRPQGARPEPDADVNWMPTLRTYYDWFQLACKHEKPEELLQAITYRTDGTRWDAVDRLRASLGSEECQTRLRTLLASVSADYRAQEQIARYVLIDLELRVDPLILVKYTPSAGRLMRDLGFSAGLVLLGDRLWGKEMALQDCFRPLRLDGGDILDKGPMQLILFRWLYGAAADMVYVIPGATKEQTEDPEFMAAATLVDFHRFEDGWRGKIRVPYLRGDTWNMDQSHTFGVWEGTHWTQPRPTVYETYRAMVDKAGTDLLSYPLHRQLWCMWRWRYYFPEHPEVIKHERHSRYATSEEQARHYYPEVMAERERTGSPKSFSDLDKRQAPG